VVDALRSTIGYGGVTADLDRDGGIRHQKGAEEDGVLFDGVGIDLGLALRGIVANDAALRAASVGSRVIPVLHLVSRDVKARPLVLRNVVRQEVTPRVVRVVLYIDGRSGCDF
jgi:hypothetical protein